MVSAYLLGNGDYAGMTIGLSVLLRSCARELQRSVYIIQGMHDWNVDPHMASQLIKLFEDAGIETKTLAGQWNHNYPDRKTTQATCGEGAEAFHYTSKMGLG